MAVDFFESPAFSPSWSHEENSLAAEITYNGDLINWDYWAGLSNISPEQAAKLCWAIDPIKWSANSYALGDVPNELSEKIQRLEQWLKSRFSSLSLSDLIDAVGKDKAPTGMIEAAERKSIDEAKKHSSDIQPLEKLTEEERSNYNSRAAWTWVDAIYILQGYKPVFQLSTEQVRSHFPDWVKYFTDSLLLGTVGKETIQAGQRIFIDSPINWRGFWQSANGAQDRTVENNSDTENETIGRRNNQLEEICKIAQTLDYSDLMNIPEGGKAKIKKECLKNKGLFTESGFEHAWKEGNKRNLFSITDKEKYS